LITVAIVTAALAGVLIGVAAARGAGPPPANVALRTARTADGTMVVTGRGMTVYIYLSDATNPPATTCTGDCANDWPPVILATPAPAVRGVDPAHVGVLVRPDRTRQLTLDGYPLYRFAGDRRPGDMRGESVGNKWYAVAPDATFLPLPAVTFTPLGGPAAPALRTLSTAAGQVVADGNGQTVYAYKDDTPTHSACTAEWCVEDWPPVLVQDTPTAAAGITGTLGVLRRPDRTLQLTLDGHPLYLFSGDLRPGDLRGQGIGGDWYALTPAGAQRTLPE
jgi:predicted lipoprotein with Yx(FWY)xxD motif